MKKRLTFCILFFACCIQSMAGHKIYFCGEEVPVTDDFVANKLMSIIKKQIPTAQLAELRYKTQKWFPWLEGELRRAGLPTDLKYLPIVESQFKNVAHSQVGAAGLWQIMPKTGTGLGLVVNPPYQDDRLDPSKSTPAACRLLRDYYSMIRRWGGGEGSWALTCAAYNWGPGNVQKVMARQGGNYYRMSMVEETSNYVYKIIAIKELWEHPERYMKNFDRNIFDKEQMEAAEEQDSKQKNKKVYKVQSDQEDVEIEMLDDRIDKDDKQTYDDQIFELKDQSFDFSNKQSDDNEVENFQTKATYSEFMALLKGISEKFHDGNLVSIQLAENLTLPNGDFKAKGQIIKGAGWLIDGRVRINLAEDVDVLFENEKGIPLDLLKKDGMTLILKVMDP